MRRPATVLLAIAVTAMAGCGSDDDDNASSGPPTTTSAAAVTTTAPSTTTSSPTAGRQKSDPNSPYVVVTSLLGKPLPKEPQCRFAKTFVPDDPSPGKYDGALALTITCEKADGYTPTGQIVNRRGSKPTEITCRDTTNGELYCIYVPSTSVGLYFTGTDRATVRRRLEHLIEVVAPLPTGVTPLPRTSSP